MSRKNCSRIQVPNGNEKEAKETRENREEHIARKNENNKLQNKLFMVVIKFVGFSILLFIMLHQERLRAQILELEVSASQKRLTKSEIEKNISQKRNTLRQCLDKYISEYLIRCQFSSLW